MARLLGACAFSDITNGTQKWQNSVVKKSSDFCNNVAVDPAGKSISVIIVSNSV